MYDLDDKRAAESLYRELENDSSLAHILPAISAHFISDDGIKRRSYVSLRAVLVFLRAPDVIEAQRQLAQSRECTIGTAEISLRRAINDVKEILIPEDEMMRAKGLMLSGGKYIQTPKELERGSDYYSIKQSVQEEHRPILARAEDLAGSRISGADRTPIAPKLAAYIAAQLMPVGKQRDEWFGVLSRKYGEDHNVHLTSAARVIATITDQLKMDLPQNIVPGTASADVRDASLKISLKNVISAKPAQGGAVVDIFENAAGVVLTKPEEISQMRGDLDTLVRRNKISDDSRKLYIWLKTLGPDGDARTVDQAVEMWNKARPDEKPLTNKQVLIAVAAVSRHLDALAAQRADESSPSYAQGHQPRPVRP